jgi:starch phosphorylase
VQFIFAGKAHPRDEDGKRYIQYIIHLSKYSDLQGHLVFIENYDVHVARQMVSGCDVWLNTPRRPLEASGTSGMKAALNGVPSLSILDGWWVEGHIEGVTGWSIGEAKKSNPVAPTDNHAEAEDLYAKLETVILPMYYTDRKRYLEVMMHAIAINGSFFNTQRMVQQYITDAYMR